MAYPPHLGDMLPDTGRDGTVPGVLALGFGYIGLNDMCAFAKR